MRSSLDPTLDVETPELVVITYTVAGIGARMKAGLIDFAICAALWLGFVMLYVMLGIRFGSFVAAWAGAVLVLLQFVIVSGYYVLMEGLRDGQTIGKRTAGIRVVKDGGYSVSFASSAARNILRLIDYQPVGFPVVGLLAMLLSKSGKRLGDVVAGTIVVREQAVPAQFAPEALGVITAPGQAPPIAVLSDAEFELLERFIARRSALPPAERAKMVSALATRFRGRIPDGVERSSISALRLAGLDSRDAAFILRLYELESTARRLGRSGRGATGAARERHAIISQGKARWTAFSSRVAEIRGKGLDKLSDRELGDFVTSYRETAGDLARLRTAARNADPGDVFYLSRVVAAGHNLFYRSGRDELATFGNYLFRRVPAEVLRSWRPIALAALVFFGPIGVTYVAVRAHPERAGELVGAQMLSRAEEGVQRARAGTGYIEDPKEARPLVGSWIITNNIKVALLAFAAGIVVIGTPMVLLFNGVSIGAVLALYANKGIFSLLAGFVIPHTLLELSAITIAGAAGLLLSAAIVMPGRLSRRDALLAAAERALRLVACATLFLLFAGTLEGFVSPNPHIPIKWKLAAAGLSLVGMVAFLSRGRRSRELRAPLSPDSD